jgi:tape measure domain-containing protein
MATYRIDFSTNASRVANEIDKVNKALTEAVRTSKPIEIRLDDTKLSQQLNTTFKQLDKEIAKYERQLRKIQIGSPAFGAKASQIGQLEGRRQMGQMTAQAVRLRGQAGAFPQESFAGLSREIQAARISASMVQPNTEAWTNLQREIARLNFDLQKADKLAENIQLTENLGAFSPGSLNALEAKLTILRNRAREISPDTTEWKQLNKEIVKVEQSIEKQTRRPLTRGQRMGAAGGAFLYGGGLGGGVGSATGGIAGGLIGGVPGAFTGAAIGQAVDNLGAMAFAMTEQANAVRRMRLGLASASTDLKDFAEANALVADISNRLLIPLGDSYRQFTRLRASTVALGIDTKTTGEIFEGISTAVMMTGGSMQDVDGAMRAVSQVFSKGKVTAEELRGQLGERLPGAVVKFAQKNNIALQDLDKAFESGQVTVDQFVTFARGLLKEGEGATDAFAKNQEYASARYAKAVENMQIAIGRAVGPMLNSIQSFAADAVNDLLWLTGQLEDFASFLENRFTGGKGGASSVFLGEGAQNIADRIIGGDVEVKDLEDRTKFFEQKIREAESQLQTIATGRYQDNRNIFERMFGGPGEENLRKGLPNQIAFYKKQLAELVKARESAEEKMKGGAATVTSATEDPAAAQRAGKFLSLVEQREESIAQARKGYEQEIRSIRENAIKQAEALERRHKDQRLQDEREIGRVRRELAEAVNEESLLRREIGGEDPALLEQERKIGDAIRQYTEDKISREEEEQDRQIAQSRELEDFKRQNADAINKANERYANAIGKIQQEYAKSVAKLIEDGSGNGAKKLAAAGRLIAAQITQASAKQSFENIAGVPIKPIAGGVEAGGMRYTSKEEFTKGLLLGAQNVQMDTESMKTLITSGKAYFDSVIAIQQAQKDLNATMKATAQTSSVAIKAVSTADLEASIKSSGEALVALMATVNKEKTGLAQQNLENKILEIIKNIRSETESSINALDKQNDAITEQRGLLEGGVLPALAEEASLRGQLFGQQERLLQGAISQLKTSEAGTALLKMAPVLHAELLSQLQKELGVLDQQEETYRNIQQQLRDNTALLEAQKIQSQIGVVGQGLRSGFINEAGAAYEEQLGKGVSPEVAASVAHATEQLTIAKTAADALQGSINGIGAAFGEAMTTGVASLISGTATAKEVFASFLQSVGQALSQAASQMIATYIAIGIAKMFAGLASASTSSTGPNPGGIPSTGNVTAPSVNGFDTGSIANVAANGAVWEGGFTPFTAFANGGVVNGPTLGLIGEGKYNEAVVPLPDGRSIPVSFGGRSARDMMGGNAPGMPQTPSLSMKFETTKINGVEYVSREQLEQAMAETRRSSIAGGAQRGMSMTLDKIKQSPSTRSSIGIR